MSKRRIRLGSGLDPNKLAGTIRQIAVTDPPLPALVCHLPEREDSWIQLTAIAEPPEVDEAPVLSSWVLMIGYPSQEQPGALLARLPIALPDGASIDAWEAGVYAIIRLSPDTPVEAIARLVVGISQHVHGVDRIHSIETALEYP